MNCMIFEKIVTHVFFPFKEKFHSTKIMRIPMILFNQDISPEPWPLIGSHLASSQWKEKAWPASGQPRLNIATYTLPLPNTFIYTKPSTLLLQSTQPVLIFLMKH